MSDYNCIVWRQQNFDCSNLKRILIARKRSLGQGNIFRSVCQEFCPQRGWYPSMPCRSHDRPAGGSALGGLLPGGACSGGVPGGDPLGRLLLRTVRILLECILVFVMILSSCRHFFTLKLWNRVIISQMWNFTSAAIQNVRDNPAFFLLFLHTSVK